MGIFKYWTVSILVCLVYLFARTFESPRDQEHGQQKSRCPSASAFSYCCTSFSSLEQYKGPLERQLKTNANFFAAVVTEIIVSICVTYTKAHILMRIPV